MFPLPGFSHAPVLCKIWNTLISLQVNFCAENIDNRQYFICTNTFTINGYGINWNKIWMKVQIFQISYKMLLKQQSFFEFPLANYFIVYICAFAWIKDSRWLPDVIMASDWFTSNLIDIFQKWYRAELLNCHNVEMSL